MHVCLVGYVIDLTTCDGVGHGEHDPDGAAELGAQRPADHVVDAWFKQTNKKGGERKMWEIAVSGWVWQPYLLPGSSRWWRRRTWRWR